ncbi:MAG TPA: protealysin inhibitor emfourin [Casimicrobiaceae bacterium]|jgi:hypothetical protein
MRIELRVDGGLASFPGLRRPVTIDCDRLPPARAARLRGLVERARFFSTQAPASSAAARDARTYTIEVDDGTQCRTLTLPEPIDDAPLRELVAEIRDCARSLRSG